MPDKLALLGVAGAGKDYIASHLKDNFQYELRAFANPLREYCRLLFPDIEQYEHPDLKDTIIPKYNMSARDIWIKMSDTIRSVDDDIWINKTLSNLPDQVIITDCRSQREFNTIKQLGFVTIWIDSYLNKRPVNQYDIDNTLTLKDLCDFKYLNSDITGYAPIHVFERFIGAI